LDRDEFMVMLQHMGNSTATAPNAADAWNDAAAADAWNADGTMTAAAADAGGF
jgi:hypothetical protein